MDNELEYIIPGVLRGDKLGYEFMSHLAGNTILCNKDCVVLDFEYCEFFEGNLCSILGNILDSLIIRNNRLELRNLSGNVRGVLSRNGFLGEYMDEITISELYHTNLPYRRFKLEDESKAKDFFKHELFDKEHMPKMSPLAQKEIIRNIFEVCLNAVTHGKCEQVYCCGQLYLRKSPSKAILTFSDLGSTIKANVNTFLRANLAGNEAIKWALTDGKTTKTGTTPGGLGLKLLQDLIYLNKGMLQVVSGDGFVEVKNNEQTFIGLDFDFPGTIITLELLLNDPNFYFLKSEENDWKDIF
jgi:hypothetical protein